MHIIIITTTTTIIIIIVVSPCAASSRRGWPAPAASGGPRPSPSPPAARLALCCVDVDGVSRMRKGSVSSLLVLLGLGFSPCRCSRVTALHTQHMCVYLTKCPGAAAGASGGPDCWPLHCSPRHSLLLLLLHPRWRSRRSVSRSVVVEDKTHIKPRDMRKDGQIGRHEYKSTRRRKEMVGMYAPLACAGPSPAPGAAPPPTPCCRRRSYDLEF